ncbi:aldehyde dehydrogenase family protein [Marinomonas sp. TI.3.20]|uniref:aldehyde dehydrogenase family protein n=1 Tax=Marinomonas sp. TI.3.20 TaxID=3121296 RepID=UPI00311F59F8
MNATQMYIDGELVTSSEKFKVNNPATEALVDTISVANKDIAQLALESAQSAKKSWGMSSVETRTKWMLMLRDELALHEEELRKAIQLETGKPWQATQEDYQLLIDSLEFYAEEIKRYTVPTLNDVEKTHRHTLTHKPVGVVVAYLSWNFPLLNLGYKLGPALASGCPIILKPSLKAPLSAYLVGAICHKIGLPKGVVNIIAGDDAEVGNYLSGSSIPSMLTLIGSINTGVKIMQAGATTIKRYSMELGGNTPYIVLDDADLDKAAEILVALKYGNSGQICVAPNRVFVHSKVKDAFIDKVLALTKTMKLGFGSDESITMGPVIDKGSRQRIHQLVTASVEQGAKILTGGEFDASEVGSFYPPTVLTGVTPDMLIYQEEIFGPVISIIDFNDDEEVLGLANDTDTGLASYVFTENQTKANFFAEFLEFGEVQINGIKYAINLPHVGIKQSGIGCDCSRYALDDYFALTRISQAL